MEYFKYFPKTFYSKDGFATTDFATNLVARFKYLDEVLQSADAFYPVVVNDGERPDTIAEKYYGDAKYTWVILSFNSYIDPLFDWPLNDEEFNAYITREYGSVANAKSEIKYYYKTLNDKKYIVDAAQSYDSSITGYDYEVELNEEKRNIKVLDRALIPKLEAQMQDLFN
jgi:hypothetical protein